MHNTNVHRSPAVRARRGNTLVLVAGILVLLVIIATSYLATTQTQRSTSVAQQAAAQSLDNAEAIAEMLAGELADALFVWPIDLEDPMLEFDPVDIIADGVADANFPRLKPAPDARRYGVDTRWIDDGTVDGRWITFGYNHAPYHTVPFTNWPDPHFVDGNPQFWPSGPGNLFSDFGLPGDGEGNAFIAAQLSAESNPLGNPGFGDTRWLRDTEPLRWDTGQFPSGITPGIPDAYSHWRKMTNVARANNGWRIVWDISDVDNHIVNNLNIPVEQWLTRMPILPTAPPQIPQPFNPATGLVNANHLMAGNPNNPNNLFWRQWRAWFGFNDAGDVNYEGVYVGIAPGTPPNLYKLNNLNANNNIHDFVIGGVPQDRPESEFIPGTARNVISRVLTDTTGDGFTDSFWFIAPTSNRSGIRQVVGISIVDNSARLNANVATRFWRNDQNNDMFRKTRGHTPADLALVGQMTQAGGADTWNVGFYDNPENWTVADPPLVRFDADYSYGATNTLRWHRHLVETGLPFEGWNVLPGSQPMNQSDRLDYWQYSARLGLTYHPGTTFSALERTYTPFSLSDELELRMFEGQNHPWIFTRYEYSVQSENDQVQTDFGGLLRSARQRAETSEYLQQLNNRELVRDVRRKLTLYSGARNDHLAPSLWWFNRRDIEPQGVQELAATPDLGWDPDDWRLMVYNNFAAQSRLKLDLREPDFWYHDYTVDGQPEYGLPYEGNPGLLNLRDRLAPALLAALTDGPDDMSDFASDYEFNSYFGPYTRDNHASTNGNLNKTRRLAAAYAANILAYRSNQPVTLADAVPLPAFGYPGAVDTGHPDHPAGRENYLPEGQMTDTGDHRSFLGIDPQPFLVEAFVAHVYKPTATVPEYYVDFPAHGIEDPEPELCNDPSLLPPGVEPDGFYSNAGQHLVFHNPEDSSNRSVILVVQIANPFDVPIDLHEYRINAFNNSAVDLSEVIPADHAGRWLFPATDDRPATAILYMIGGLDGVPDFQDKWRQFLDINITGSDINQVTVAGANEILAPGTVLVNMEMFWSQERALYDGANVRDSIVLRRRDTSIGPDDWVVIDRFDPDGHQGTFARAVRHMGDYRPREAPDPICSVPPNDQDDDRYPGYAFSSDSHHFVQWVRATRAWGVDVNGNGLYENHERNPRYVFGDRAVVVPTLQGTPILNGSRSFEQPRSPEDGTFLVPLPPDDPGETQPPRPVAAGANAYNFDDDPDGEGLNDVPWFARKYYTADGRLRGDDQGAGPVANPSRKPTFFDMNFIEDPVSEGGTSYFWSYPDKGWYGQFSIEESTDDPGIYRFRGIGGTDYISYSNVSRIEWLNGVDDMPVLHGEMQDLDGNTITWDGALTPLFRHPFAMQMTLKNKLSDSHFGDPAFYPEWFTLLSGAAQDNLRLNRDFEQIGEVLNVWLFGHEIKLTSTGEYDSTETTFSEFLGAANAELTGLPSEFPVLGPDSFDGEYERWLRSGNAHRVNRLLTQPVEVDGEWIGRVLNRPVDPDPASPDELAAYRADARHAWPAIPAGARVLDLFTLDGPGSRFYYDPVDDRWWDSGLVEVGPEFVDRHRFYNANDFTGRMTPGLLNINTATPEVLRALPHMTRIVGEWPPGFYPFSEYPFPLVTEAMIRYRDRIGLPVWGTFGADWAPAYAHRGRWQDFFAEADDNVNSKFIPGLRGERGFASIGELSLLTQSGRREKDAPNAPDEFLYLDLNANAGFDAIDWNNSWRIDYPTMPDRHEYWRTFPTKFEPGHADNPFAYLFIGTPEFQPPGMPPVPDVPLSARISTDTVDLFVHPDLGWPATPGYPAAIHPDITAEDAHEANLLLAGISNLVTTRSDTFTVHFRVRSFRQNPVTGVWDATDPEYIVDDARYVMLVDRSNVNRPTDRPKILYLERLPK